MEAAQDWGRYSPARKVEIIREVYEPDKSSAVQLAERISKKYKITVTKNAVIGLYGRRPELKASHPLTGSRNSSAKGSRSAVSPEARRIAMQARLLREQRRRDEKERKRLDAEARKRKREEKVDPLIKLAVAERRKALANFFAEESYAIPLVELTESVCHWPEGEGPYVFCGRTDLNKGRTYCQFHARLAYALPQGN